MTLTVGSLFSGIGGIDLGLERAGMTVLWQAETDPYASRVLAKHWPGVPNHGDVTAVDWSTVARPDLLAGGYPCQPFSLAGARQGTEDPRHLWPHFARAIRHLRPDWVLLENVPGHLTLGFGTVLADLAALGYDTEWECIPAAAVGAPHLRWRLFLVAYPHSNGQPGQSRHEREIPGVLVPDADRGELREQPVAVGRRGGTALARVDGPDRAVADTDDSRCDRRTGIFGPGRRPEPQDSRPGMGHTYSPSPDTFSAPGGPRPAAGKPGWWDVEPEVGRVAHGIPSRMDRLRGLGNAVVPQVAEYIGRRIVQADALEHQGAA